MDYISTFVTLGGVIQSHNQHSNEIKINNELTQKQIDESNRLHQEQIDISYDIHDIQHNHNKFSAERECLRDMWEQKNHKNQTLVITLTLLYSCCFIILIEGALPENTDNIVIFIYQFFLSLSIITITISLILLLKLQSRMTNFNIFDRNHVYDCGESHSTFESYYDHHCRKIKRYSVRLCNLGLISIYITGVIYWSCKLYYIYYCIYCLIVFNLMNFIGILIILYIFVLIK